MSVSDKNINNSKPDEHWEEPKMFYNFDLENIVTPVNVKELGKLLRESCYNESETEFILDGFTNGFDIGYEGPEDRQDSSQNIPIRNNLGSKFDLWDKVMKEVSEGRYTGPFEQISFKNYIQSPIGLVPKAGNKTRQIFHLSYDFPNGNKSVHFHMPKDKCSVKYNDLDAAVRMSLKMKKKLSTSQLRYTKTDAKSAFRTLPLSVASFQWLAMKA